MRKRIDECETHVLGFFLGVENCARPMLDADRKAARERRRLRSRANQMQRAVCAVHLAVDGLSATERLVVLNECLQDSIEDYDRGSDDDD